MDSFINKTASDYGIYIEKKQRVPSFHMTAEHSHNYCEVFFLKSGKCIYTIKAGLLDEALLLDFLDHKPEKLEVILTGQGPSEELMKRADYISEICMRKHPFEKGIPARPGIER